ncbi:MAG: hypothetical protein RhofKO_20680 [Rhodothermales bacterium]
MAVALLVLTTTYFSVSVQTTSKEAEDAQTQYAEEVIASRISESALNIAISKAERDFSSWRAGYGDTQFNDGAFNVQVTGPATGPIQIVSDGAFERGEFRVSKTLMRLAKTPAAVMLNADSAVVTLQGTNWRISGRDTPAAWRAQTMQEGHGRGNVANAFWAKSDKVRQAMYDVAGPQRMDLIRGQVDQNDMVGGDLTLDPSTLWDEAEARASVVYDAAQTFSPGTQIGSLYDPKVTHVKGDATFEGASGGHGVLLVEGNLVADDDFEWHGLVLARGEGTMKVALNNKARVYGALLVDHTAGHFMVSIPFGGAKFPPYSAWAIDNNTDDLRYYTFSEGEIGINVEGEINGINENKLVPEALTIAPDGTIYFVNANSKGNVYKINPNTFDKNSGTAVDAEFLFNANVTGNDKITGLVFVSNTLYALHQKSQKISKIDLASNTIVDVNTYSPYSPNVNNFNTIAATLGSDGRVYVTRGKQIWVFDSFPYGNPTRIANVSSASSGFHSLAAHPDGYLYAYDKYDWYRVNPSTGSSEKVYDLEADLRDAAFYYPAEVAGLQAMGASNLGSGKIIVCHKQGNENAQDLEVNASALNGHLGHGDKVGSCASQGGNLQARASTLNRGPGVVKGTQASGRPRGIDIIEKVKAKSSDAEASTFADDHLPGIRTFLSEKLCEGCNINDNLYPLDATRLKLTYPANPRVYFVGEGAGYKNTTGFTTNGPRSDIENDGGARLMFPNSSMNNPLVPGDFVNLGTMSAGTTLDFFVISNGYNKPYNHTYWADENHNPDGINHVVGFILENSPFLIVGFEDLYNGGDRDFNDVLIAIDIGIENAEALVADMIPPGHLSYEMRGDASVMYSTEALGRLAVVMPTFAQEAWVVSYDQTNEPAPSSFNVDPEFIKEIKRKKLRAAGLNEDGSIPYDSLASAIPPVGGADGAADGVIDGLLGGGNGGVIGSTGGNGGYTGGYSDPGNDNGKPDG